MQRDDSLWKAILEDTFDDFLKFFFDDANELFDFEKGFEYLDKELAQLFPPEEDEYKPRYVDKLVKVFTRQGDEEWILVHIEVQGYADKNFGKRMFLYYNRIFDKYDKPITAFAIFTDSDHNFHPQKFEQSLLGTSLTYTFNTYKILEQSDTELLNNENPFSMVVLTVKTAIQGKLMNDEQLFNLRIDLVKRLLSKNIPKQKIRSVMNFLRYYIRFESQELMDKFVKEEALITQNTATMGIEEFLLERARKEGLQKGLEEGLEKGIEKGLEKGREQEKKEIVANLLQKSTFSVDQIAEIVAAPVAFVEQVKESLKR